MSTQPTRRTWFKTGRDALVVAVPAALLWVNGHTADLQSAGISAENAATMVGLSTFALFIWRAWRDFRGTAPV